MTQTSQTEASADHGLKAAIVPVTPFQQNCTLIWDTKSKVGAVIDPGGDLELIERAIADVGMKPEKIVLTHGHIDHAGGAAELSEKLGIPIEGPHEAEKPLLDKLAEQGQAYGMLDARPVAPDRWLAEGDTVTMAGQSFEVLHCPGHSPGSVVLVNRPQRFAFVGDVLFQGSIGRTDLPMGDHETLIKSIREKVLPLGDEFAFICGHGPTGTIGHERTTNPFLQGDGDGYVV